RASVKTRRWDEAAIGALEETGEGEAAPVTVLWSNDLHTDWQPLFRQPGGCDGRRQIDEAGEPRPEQGVNRRRRVAVDLDHAFPALAVMIMIVRVGCPGRDRAQQQIIIAKKFSPSESQPVALLIAREPTSVSKGDAPHHMGKVAVVGRIEPVRRLD